MVKNKDLEVFKKGVLNATDQVIVEAYKKEKNRKLWENIEFFVVFFCQVFILLVFLLVVGFNIFVYSNAYMQVKTQMALMILAGNFLLFLVLSSAYIKLFEEAGKKEREERKNELP